MVKPVKVSNLLLAVDIGNSNIVVGLFQNAKLMAEWRMATDIGRTPDEYAGELQNFLSLRSIPLRAVKQAILSSVVPPLTPTLCEAIETLCHIKPAVIIPEQVKQLTLKIDQPKEVGADRLVNAVAAYQLYGGPCIIIDFGTATTFCAVTKKGEYIGGAITAGPKITRDALFQRTSKLPKVELAKPKKIIGSNTVETMQSGLFYGHIDLVEGMVKRFKKILGSKAKVIATGGLSKLFQSETNCFDIVNPALTLQGLQMIHAAKNPVV